MSTALPRPSRPTNGPPTIALPALPVGKTRKSTGNLATPAPKSSLTTPKSGLRAPSSSLHPPPSPLPAPSSPTQPRSASGVNGAGKTLRKTISVSAFPQPPRGDTRISSLPPSPLSATHPRKLRTPTTPTYQPSSSTPSFLNGTGDGKSISRDMNARNSDGLISVASPPQSRSSSAQDSYSTSATQYDDVHDVAPKADSGKRSSKSDGKGNVVVSVRVRPDLNGNEIRSDEWLIDGKRSLIGFRGKEGGDYYYGMNHRKTCNPRVSA
jgi:centromeric protein E